MNSKAAILAAIFVAALTGCGKNSTGNTYGGAGAPTEGPVKQKNNDTKSGGGGTGGSWGP